MAASGISKLGRVALDLGFLNIKQLEECLQIQFDFQKEGKEVPRLGSVFISKGYITSEQLQVILEKQKDSKYENASASTTDILRTVPAGTYIYEEGDDPAQSLFLIHQGQIDFYRGNELVESIKDKGRFFGIVSYLTSTKYTESAVAARDSKIFAIPSKEVNNFFKTHPDMSMKIAKNLAKKLYASILDRKALSNKIDSAKEQSKAINVKPEPIETDASAIRQKALSKKNASKTVIDDHTCDTNSNVHTHDNSDSIIDKAQDLNDKINLSNNINESERISEFVDTSKFKESDLILNKPSFMGSEKPTAYLQVTPLEEVEELETILISDEVECGELLSEINSLKPTCFSDDIVSAVKDQVKLFIEIEEIDRERIEFLNSLSNPSEIIKAEISKQRKEISRIPSFSIISARYSKLNELLSSTENDPSKVPEITENPTLDSSDTIDNTGGSKIKTEIDITLRRAYEFSVAQKELLIKRHNSFEEILQKCSLYSNTEPFYIMLSKHNIDPVRLFGWGVYHMALSEYSTMQNDKIEAIKEEQKEADQTLKSLVGRLKINKKAEEERDELIDQLATREKELRLIQTIVKREQLNITKDMVEEFWTVYTKVAKLLITDISGIDKVMAKCFLRWGLLGYTSKWIDPEKCSGLIRSCSEALYSPKYSTSSTFIYYSDEVIELAAKGYIPTSPNEELELNHRNSPEWRCDKSFKRYSHLKIQQGIILDVLKEQKDELRQIGIDLAEAEKKEQSMVRTHAKNLTFKHDLSALRQEIQSFKVKSTRIDNIITKINDEMLPKIIEDSKKAVSNIINSEVIISIDSVIEHEIKTIRRCSRLVAKLKEPFLPFSLRDLYRSNSDIINNREVLTESIKKIEHRDPLIFKSKLIPSAKRRQRILLRRSPFIIISPASGILGFVIAPSTGIENGRLVLPGYFDRSMISESVLHTVFADFRFDCSKADAGVDIMTSETLVAAYATYRWNMRKKKKEIRKKAAVYLDETERMNWRRHYSVYMNSALDSGKFLFYKSPELYDIIINNYIDLPEGCEKLKK